MVSGTCTIETAEPTVSIASLHAYVMLTQNIDIRTTAGTDHNLDEKELTEHYLGDAAITAVNGQIISINIEISFS